MPLPKRRHSNARTRKRRAHDFLTPVMLAICPKCNEPKLPHCVCGNCGFYGGRTVVAEKKS